MAAPITQKIESKGRPPEKKEYFTIIRIMQTDIPGNKNLLTGLTYLKGVSWGISNATCKLLKLDPRKKISDLTPQETEKIVKFLDEEISKKLPKFMLNRRKDFETGEDVHLTGTDLDMKREFDIRRLKKIRSYRGLRHATGQPTRGQRTKSHFRNKKKNKVVGVQKKANKPSK
ncbi:30S ribosomal protein S13 [Candidatus Pacearchaeota archaeon]|nr:30S ribosomal protein S13 [Candidatus Pacearchaeota archaeon]